MMQLIQGATTGEFRRVNPSLVVVRIYHFYEAYVSNIVYYTWTFCPQFHCVIDGVAYYI